MSHDEINIDQTNDPVTVELTCTDEYLVGGTRTTRLQGEAKQFLSCNELVCRVGTNCPCGGDTGHGGRTVFELHDLAGSDMGIEIVPNEHGADGVRIVLGGDSEVETFVQALTWAAETLRKQLQRNAQNAGER